MKSILIIFTLIVLLPSFGFSQVTSDDDFSHPHKYGWDSPEKLFSYRQDLQKRQKLLQLFSMKKQHISENLVRSAIIPGWGQYTAQRYTKGQIIFVSEIAILAGSYFVYREAMDNFDKYKKANYIGNIEKFYNRAQTRYEQSQMLLGAGILLWLFNIYDSIGSTEAFNADTWNTLYQDKTKMISVDFNGISFKF